MASFAESIVVSLIWFRTHFNTRTTFCVEITKAAETFLATATVLQVAFAGLGQHAFTDDAGTNCLIAAVNRAWPPKFSKPYPENK